MKRNWEIIREILVTIEESNEQVGLDDFSAEQHAEISYHMELLIEAGLVDGQMDPTFGVQNKDFSVRRLSWDGHEFIDAIRNDTIWEKTKNKFSDEGFSMTFELAKNVATNLITSILV